MNRIREFYKKPIALFILLFLIVLVKMLAGLNSFFDPQDFITFLNPLARGDSMESYFLDGWGRISDTLEGGTYGFFRPLTSLTYVPEYFIWGSRPLFYRIVNLFLLTFVAFTVGRISRLLGGKGRSSAFLMVAAPGSVFAVWWITGRGDILAPLFCLLAVGSTITLMQSENTRTKNILFPALFCLLATASKEMGIMSVPAVVLTYFILSGKLRETKGKWIFAGSLVSVCILTISTRLLVFGGMGGYTATTSPEHIIPHIGTLIVQMSGAELIKWEFLRVILPFLLFVPPAFYLTASRENFRKGVLLLLLILLFGIQSMIGDTCQHYIFAPLLVFCILLGLSLEYMAKRYHISFVLSLVPLIAVFWFMSSVAGVETLDRRSQSYEDLYMAAEDIWLNKREALISPVLILPEFSGEEKKISLYFDHIAGGDCELDFIVIPLNSQPDLATIESTAITWNGSIIVIHNPE